MTLYYLKDYIVFVLLVLQGVRPISAATIDFTQCLADVIACAQNASDSNCVSTLNISSATAYSILLTSEGTPASVANATALSYTGCATYCGTAQESFSWSVFSQEFAAWLLPYLALLSQLPFGAKRRMNSLMSAVLTLGSPTLAGYSLYMTLLNARWINEKVFSGIDYPSSTIRQAVVQVLSDLQQVPLRVHPGESGRFESLVVHPDNDEWWTVLAEELDYSQTWSIASAISILWVVVAYLLTVIDSLSNVSNNIDSNGQGTGSGWLWLLSVVIGWLVLSPKCDYRRVHDAYNRANRQVFVADPDDPTAGPTPVTSNFGLTICPHPDQSFYGRDFTSPDELQISPIFNYARIFSWYRNVYLTSLFYRTAWRKSNARVGVNSENIAGNVRNDIPRESRLGTRDQIICYCRPNDHEYHGVHVFWPRGLIFNMIVASLMSLLLQWGTTGAAVLVVWSTPTVGLGCRSLAYLIYGALSTVVWMLLVMSSVLGYHATITASLAEDGSGFPGGRDNVAVPLMETRAPDSDMEGQDTPSESDEPGSITEAKYSNTRWTHARMMARTADLLRWTGKLLAIINAIGITANSLFQYIGLYNNCYCDSSVFFWGTSAAFDVIAPNTVDISLAREAWIGALVLGLTSCSIFVGTIYLIRDSLPSYSH